PHPPLRACLEEWPAPVREAPGRRADSDPRRLAGPTLPPAWPCFYNKRDRPRVPGLHKQTPRGRMGAGIASGDETPQGNFWPISAGTRITGDTNRRPLATNRWYPLVRRPHLAR